MPALGDNANVWNTCLLILRQNGYLLRLESDDPETTLENCFWVAEKNGYDLWASNPIELLGLAAIHQHQKPIGPPTSYWWRIDGEDIVNELCEAQWPSDASPDLR